MNIFYYHPDKSIELYRVIDIQNAGNLLAMESYQILYIKLFSANTK